MRPRGHRVDGHGRIADHPDIGHRAPVLHRDAFGSAAEAGIAAGHRPPAFGSARQEQAERHGPGPEPAVGPGRRRRQGCGLRFRRPPGPRRPRRRPAPMFGDLRQERRQGRVFEHARAERIDRCERAFPKRRDQARHADAGRFVELQRVRHAGPEPAPDDPERARAGHGADHSRRRSRWRCPRPRTA